jgi:PAS domain S-box-containing protein
MDQEINKQNEPEKLIEALRISEEKWRSFVNKSPDGIVVTRIDGYIEEISAKTLNMFDYSRIEDGLGKNVMEFIEPSFHEKVKRKITGLLAGEMTGVEEFLAVKRDGSQFFIEVNSEVIRNCMGEPVSFIHIIRDITKRKNTENALIDRETEYHRLYQMFRLMSDTMPDMMWAKDLDKKYIFANKAVCENLLCALNTSEPIGKTDMFFAERERNSHPENPEWHTFGELCRDTDEITLKELRQMHFKEFGNVKGKFLFLDVHKAPLFNTEGQLIGVVGSARDVTEKIHSEKRISMLAQAIQSVSECVSITDMNDNIIYVNNAFLKTYQYEESELIGQPISMVRSFNNSSDHVSKILPSTLKGGWHGEVMNRKKDGSEFPVHISTSVITDEQGKQQWLIGVSTDISEQKKAQRELHESEARTKALLSAIPDLMFMFNRQGDFIDFHVRDQKSLFIEPELFLNRNVREVLPHDLAVETLEHLSEVFDNGTTSVYEYSIQVGNEIQLFESRIVPCGKDSALSIVRDVTDQRKLESQMIQSERLAALGEMSAGMAHEINQPLNTLSMLFDNILFEAQENHSVSENYLVSKSEKIFNNIVRIKNIIDHVREFSRESDRDILTPFNVNESIHNAVSMVSEQYKMAGIEMKLDLDENLPLIKGSNYKFERIILNLIINSKDALIQKLEELNESYMMNIRINSTFDKGMIKIEVSDNGCGIPKERLNKVLQPFYTTKETGKGTGLGLSISYGLVRELGGDINIQSKVLRGTTIIITIPCKSSL